MLFTGLTNKKRRKKIRGIIRGYRILKKDKRLNLIEELKSKMSKCTFSDNQKHYSVAVFGAAHASAELVVKQYMYSKFLLNNKFNKSTKTHKLLYKYTIARCCCLNNKIFCIIYKVTKAIKIISKTNRTISDADVNGFNNTGYIL